MPATTCRPAVGEGGVLCQRCGRQLDDDAVLVIINDVIERYCSLEHAADTLTSRRVPAPPR